MNDNKPSETRNIKTEGGHYIRDIRGNYIEFKKLIISFFFIGKSQHNANDDLFNYKPSDKAIPPISSSSDYKYDGNLVNIGEISFFKSSKSNKKVNVILHISFGEVIQRFKGQHNKEGSIRFGIKFGELVLDLINAEMPLNQRGKFPTANKIGVKVSPVGLNNLPEWQFKADQNGVLFGQCSNEKLGILDIEKSDFKVVVIFKSETNSNSLYITDATGFDERYDKKTVETIKRGILEKYVKPKLESYIVRLEYELELLSLNYKITGFDRLKLLLKKFVTWFTNLKVGRY